MHVELLNIEIYISHVYTVWEDHSIIYKYLILALTFDLLL